VFDLPGVGENFQDHPNVTLFHLADHDIDCHYPQVYGFHRANPHSDLAPDQAEVVFLRVLAGFDVEDVAAVLGKTPGAVRVLQHRALRRLREQLTTERTRGGVTQ